MGRKPKEHTYNVQQDLLNFKEKLKAQAKDIVGENALEITQNVTSQGLTLPSDIFTFQPVSPKQFIESSEYFGNNTKKRIYPWIIDILEEVFSGPFHCPKYSTVAIMAGKGSGKSYCSALANTYGLYWLNCFNNFFRFLKIKDNIDLDPFTTIHFVNMALTKDQAKEIVFDNTVKFINEIQMFNERNWLPDPKVKTELIFYGQHANNNMQYKKCRIVPGNSSSSFALGLPVFIATIDEACFWIEKHKNPVIEVYNELDTRRFTRFKNNGVIMLISSANTEGDFVCSFEDKAKVDPSILFKRLSIYDCQPQYFTLPRFELKVKRERMDGTIEDVTLHPPEILKQAYERDLDTSLKDYDAIPRLAGKPFYTDWMLVMSKINRNRVDPCPDLGIDKTETPDQVQKRLPLTLRGIPGNKYRIHVDLAKGTAVKGHCGVGFAMSHKIADVNYGFKIVLDLAVRFKAPENKEVQINDILNLILFLKNERDFDIDAVTFDQWNSLQPIQTINNWNNGIKAEELAVGYKQHAYLKNCINTGQFDFFEDNNLLFELKRIEDYGNECIDHGIGSFKDESDAVAGCAYSSAALEAGKAGEIIKPRIATGIVLPQNTNINRSSLGFYKGNFNSRVIPLYRRGM